jgi:hypothetical protein
MVEEVAGTRRSGRQQRIQETEVVPETED